MLLLFVIVSLSSMAQTREQSYFKITQKECIKRAGYTLVLKKIITDSRCPEGLNCIWQGEAQVLVSVYKDKKLIEDVSIALSPKMVLENNLWFAKYSKDKYKNIQAISLMPYPKKEVLIKPKDYYLKLAYRK